VHGGAEAFLVALEAQEPWSDLPIILLAEAPRGVTVRTQLAFAMFERANVTVLERPVRGWLLISTLRAAIRARRRQYQTRDILRDLQDAIELRDMFVSILGHDLRTPLHAIRMSAGAIVRGANEAQALRPAGRIIRAADRMTRMLEQLLDFARARQPQGMVVQPGPAALDEITRPAVEELEDTYPTTRIELVEKGNLLGTWDADRLGRVVSNLVGNAVKHGTPDMPVVVELDGTQADVARIRVTSSGSIPAESIPVLFEPFKRTNPAKTGERGLGLGLFIAREIAVAHGGDVVLLATEGDVTTFEVYLPRHGRVE
jgi:signal transduction histidine kinase